ncbi:unnamed protein product [Effrenium voratum]|nr:unnamed protein product [Effrenium voratum]
MNMEPGTPSVELRFGSDRGVRRAKRMKQPAIRAMGLALWVWLPTASAIVIQDRRANLSVPGACARPSGWCNPDTYYRHEDCNLDGVLDQVCEMSYVDATDKKKWFLLSGDCSNEFNTGDANAGLPSCQEIQAKGGPERSGEEVYRTKIAGVSTSSTWEKVAKGTVTSLAQYQDTIFGLGTPAGKLYRQSFSMMSPSTTWHLASKGKLTGGDAAEGTFFGVSEDGKVYCQKISEMTDQTDWKKCIGKGSLHKLAIHKSSGTIYGLDSSQKMFKLSDPISSMTDASDWISLPYSGACWDISIRGDNVYCRGGGDSLWTQDIIKMTAHSGWTKIGEDGTKAVLVPEGSLCKGALLNRDGDDFACDTIKDETCGNFYERAGQTDIYLQCVGQEASPGTGIVTCLAKNPCSLGP